jgi:hypothetical protein
METQILMVEFDRGAENNSIKIVSSTNRSHPVSC